MDFTTEREGLVVRMRGLLDAAKEGDRFFTDAEQKTFDECKASIEKLDKMAGGTDFLDRQQTRPLAKAAKTIFDAIVVDKLVQRMLAQGKATLDIPGASIRAIGSSQANSPAPGITVQAQNFGLVQTYAPIVYRLLSALSSTPVSGNAVFYTRVHYASIGSPTIPENGNHAAIVQELAQKPESVLATEDVTQTLKTFAHYVKSSKQVLTDLTGLRNAIDNLLLDGLLDIIDGHVFATLTTAGNFTAFTPTSTIIADQIARLATTMLTAGATDVKVAMHPDTLLAMRTVKADSSGVYLGLPDVPASLVSSATVPAGHLLAFDSKGAQWGEREGASVTAGLDGVDFTNNRVTLLCEARGEVLIYNPKFVRYGASNT